MVVKTGKSQSQVQLGVIQEEEDSRRENSDADRRVIVEAKEFDQIAYRESVKIETLKKRIESFDSSKYEHDLQE